MTKTCFAFTMLERPWFDVPDSKYRVSVSRGNLALGIPDIVQQGIQHGHHTMNVETRTTMAIMD